MRNLASLLRTPMGFMVITVCGGAVVFYVIGWIGTPKALEAARHFWSVAALVGGIHLKLIADLHALRDAPQLNRPERTQLRQVVTHQTGRIWLFIFLLIAMAIVGVAASALSSEALLSLALIAWMGLVYALYSILLAVGWSQEIAEFKSTLFDRQRREEAAKTEVEALRKEPQRWIETGDLKGFTESPPAGNHNASCC